MKQWIAGAVLLTMVSCHGLAMAQPFEGNASYSPERLPVSVAALQQFPLLVDVGEIEFKSTSSSFLRRVFSSSPNVMADFQFLLQPSGLYAFQLRFRQSDVDQNSSGFSSIHRSLYDKIPSVSLVIDGQSFELYRKYSQSRQVASVTQHPQCSQCTTDSKSRNRSSFSNNDSTEVRVYDDTAVYEWGGPNVIGALAHATTVVLRYDKKDAPLLPPQIDMLRRLSQYLVRP